MKLLKFENITFGYKKEKPVFKGLSFELIQTAGKGFVVGLMGGSGSGKSTILKLILGIETNYQGKIIIAPEDPTISYVPQEPVLFEHLTPRDNAEYFSRISNYKSRFNRELFDEIAKALNIEYALKTATSVNEISGGQKQRISVLRALSIQPDILLLDEPLTGLDEEVKDQFLQTLATLIQKFDLMVIYVTHHRKEAEFISDTILYLERDRDEKVVKKVSLADAKSFFITPPTISALNATKETSVNTLHFKQKTDGGIYPIESTLISSREANTYVMSFPESTIRFSQNSGFEFKVVAETGTYTLLKIKDSHIVFTVDSGNFHEQYDGMEKFVTLSGDINLYDNNGQFLASTEIENNRILKKSK